MASKFEKYQDDLLHYASQQAYLVKTSPRKWLTTHSEKAIQYLLSKPKTSPRTHILCFAITAKIGVERANELLKRHGYEALYIRNMNDMACMWALQKGGTAADVSALFNELSDLRSYNQGRQISPYISLSSINAYLEAVPDNPFAEAGKMTAQLQQNFDQALINGETAIDVARNNISYFTSMRDRTRHEFLLIFRDYLTSVITSGDPVERDLVLRTSQLRVHSGPEKRNDENNSKSKKNIVFRIEDCKVNYANFVSRIDDYFQGALFSADWVTDTGSKRNDTLSEDKYQKMSTEEKSAFLNEQDETDNAETEEFHKCVKTFREFVQGKTDITRTFFIASILYMNTHLDMASWIDLDALNIILSACGWRQVQSVNPSKLDKLVIYLYSKDSHVLGYTPHFIYDDMYNSLLADSMEEFADYAGFNPTKSRDETFGQALDG